MAQQKIRIRLKGYDHQQLDRSAQQIVDTAQRSGATITGPVPLPTEPVQQQPVRTEKTPGRNEPCFCGSGKKYKLCHGR